MKLPSDCSLTQLTDEQRDDPYARLAWAELNQIGRDDSLSNLQMLTKAREGIVLQPHPSQDIPTAPQ